MLSVGPNVAFLLGARTVSRQFCVGVRTWCQVRKKTVSCLQDPRAA